MVGCLSLCSDNPPCCFAQKTSPAAKETTKKTTPWREKPMMVPWLIVLSTALLLVADTPHPPQYPAQLFWDIPLCSVQLCTWSRTCRWLLTPLPPAAAAAGVLFPSLSSRTFPVSFRADATRGNLSALAFLWLCPSCGHGLRTALWLSASRDLSSLAVMTVVAVVTLVGVW